ncbi:serine protease snake-like [Schistocerca piceifrons]|uniref:serine protease snake-like n=1 Tax=Schistocerca piceifrons TaxID=274613 RepID=UPI001F5F56AB|nr:serine protease snake-like [Schistocerca piceifrons]
MADKQSLEEDHRLLADMDKTDAIGGKANINSVQDSPLSPKGVMDDGELPGDNLLEYDVNEATKEKIVRDDTISEVCVMDDGELPGDNLLEYDVNEATKEKIVRDDTISEVCRPGNIERLPGIGQGTLEKALGKPETPPNGLPESPTKQPNRRFGSEFQPPTTQFGNTSSQKTRRSISEEKCDEYTRSVQDIFEALPLLPDADPLIIKVDKCDFENLPLIVGGEDTDVGEFPHMAAIGYQVDGNLEWNCGGSLISEYYVLTAAHCSLTNYRYPAVIVRLGEMNLKRDDDGAHPVDYHIADLVRHPEYKGPSKYNDIALLRLSERVDFNKFIRPACLYTHDKFSVSKTVATGWGKIEYAGKTSDTLRKVVLDIIDNEMCNNLWKSLRKLTSLPRGIAPSMMCAGVLTGGKDTCQGDSGGPIQISTKGNQCVYHVIGVTSFGSYCAGEDSPGIYTRLSSFIPWIESIVWPDG